MQRIDILLATYESGQHLRPLLDSLVRQTRNDFRLLVSDDCSTDDTVRILESYKPHFSDMQIIERSSPSGSAKANFAFLLDQSDADFILFCDADDIWDEDKVAVTVNALESNAMAAGSDVPIYVFGDARIIDADSQPVQESFWRFKRLRPCVADTLTQDIVCPPMLGCASGINRALKVAASPIPLDEVTGHDWWLYLVAKTIGRVGTIDRPLLSYRIHGNNSSQQRRVNLVDYARESGKIARVRRGMHLRQKQALALLDKSSEFMDHATVEKLRGFAGLHRKNFVERRLFLIRNGFLYPDLPRNLAMMLAT